MQNQQITIIKPHSHLLQLNLKELFRYKDLLMMYVKRDIVTFYKQTVLGPLWFVIQPILTTVMFMFVFGNMAGISTDGIPQPFVLIYPQNTISADKQLSIVNKKQTYSRSILPDKRHRKIRKRFYQNPQGN